MTKEGLSPNAKSRPECEQILLLGHCQNLNFRHLDLFRHSALVIRHSWSALPKTLLILPPPCRRSLALPRFGRQWRCEFAVWSRTVSTTPLCAAGQSAEIHP